MNNKSKIYGYYGGVTEENRYTPPESPTFVPQPPKPIPTNNTNQQNTNSQNTNQQNTNNTGTPP